MTAQHKNSQRHVRKALDQLCETSDATLNRISGVSESNSFCSNPAEYEWRYIGKNELLVPYHCDAVLSDATNDLVQSNFPHPKFVRWEKHCVWIVEGTLRRGESNVMVRRRFYLDKNSWLILLGEGYDITGALMKCYMFYASNIPGAGRRGRWYPASH